MALLNPIILCVIDREPTSFHENDAANPTVAFAMNLSFEVPSDGVEANPGDDEAAAKAKFLDFLSAVHDVQFHIYQVERQPAGTVKLTHDSPVGRVSEAPPLGSPADLHGWLEQQKLAAPYWTTKGAWAPDVAVEVDAAGATHRLRAAQGWNAPVGHKFALTHILRIPEAITANEIVVLPYFDPAGAPAPMVEGEAVQGGPSVFDFKYDMLGTIGLAACRTTVAPGDLAIDPAIDPGGYLKIDKDAAKTHRLLTWFEARAASLMAVNPALNSRSRDAEKDEPFEQLFGLHAAPGVPPAEEVFHWGSLVWFVVARLVATLDSLVLGLLKPVRSTTAEPAFDRASEGDIVAPLVSLLRDRLKNLPTAVNLDEAALESQRITASLRFAIASGSPLSAKESTPQPKTNADLADVLRQVYGIDAPKSDDAVTDARELIAEILARYAAGGNETKLPDRAQTYAASIKGKSAATMARTLLDLEQPVQEEAGAEAAILKVIASAQRGRSVANRIADAYLDEIAHGDKPTVLPAVEAAVDQALADYRRLLDSPFNGAEATRRASSGAFIRNLLDFAAVPVAGRESSVVLTEAITTSAFYSRRLGVTDAGASAACFDPLIAALAMPDRGFLLAPPDDARKHFDAAFDDAVTPLAAVNDPNARFIPDSTPQPLAIQIAANIDGSKIDDFTKHFNGIAVAVRRRDAGGASDRWAHAHLADLDWTPKEPAQIAPPPARGAKAALHPMLPAISDGRGAMFIEYEGFPFADPAFDARIVGNEEETHDNRELFYRQAPHKPIYPPGGPPKPPPIFAQVPRLAYGRRFDTFSFITTNAGTLPLTLQRTIDRSPWMPRPDIQEPDASLIGEAECQRRTAIAQMAVVEEVMGAQPRRIGAPIAGVMPLAADYPRVGLKAESGAPAVHDIFREADGSGRMIIDAIPEGAHAEWRISEMRFSGVPARLILRFFDRHARTGDPGKEFTIDETTVPGFAGLREIVVRVVHMAAPIPVPPPPIVQNFGRRLQVICGGVLLGEESLPGNEALAGWLRLQLEATAQPVTLTFADPGEQKTGNVVAPLLLLAPDDGVWKRGFADPVTATVSTPRVGYLDFERWFANGDLYTATFAAQPQAPDTPAARFMRALLTAYVMRHLHPRVAELINRLPDPAIEAVRLELTALDRLSDHEPGTAGAEQHDLAGRLKTFAEDLASRDDWTLGELIRDVLEPLDKLFQFTVRLSPGAGLSLTSNPAQRSFATSVPAGVVARLSIDALVPAQHFQPAGGHPAVFHAGLTQYAPRAVGSFLAFPGAAIRVETMYDDRKLFAASRDNHNNAIEHFNNLAIELAGRMITADGVERVRRFDLISAAAVPPVAGEPDARREELTRRWRLLGEIDATTQRFRPGGQPIYHYVNPRAHRRDEVAEEFEVKHPALPLKFKDGDLTLAEFELEAFFDRPDVDAHTVTQRLDPLGSRTKLQEHHWNSEAASYFRHRFTLRSRYAGALTQADRREVNAWPTGKLKTTAHGWTHRVAMLADLSRMLLTRPQLRALIPLTTAPGGEDTGEPAPPVAGILQEPPFGRGGLADRIAAEIKTGFGYGFEDDDPDTHVEIRDSRKEGGTDPHLAYRPLNAEAALGLVLRAEGPIGLTFDNINAPAPALPNAIMLLKPDTLFKPDALNGSRLNFEEFFTGVVLRRYIDPGWTTSRREPEGPLDGERCWWIDVKAVPSRGVQTLLQYTVEGDPVPRPLVEVESDDKRVFVKTSKLAIDGVGGMRVDKDLVEVALIARSEFSALSFLHQPVAPGRYSTAVFVRVQSAKTERGEANLPLTVASFEWSPNKSGGGPDQRPPFVQILRVPKADAYVTMASAPTFLRWTRTGRDFDFVQLAFDEHGKWQPQRRHVREIVANLNPDHEFLTFRRRGASKPTWLLPSTFCNPYPLHLHRHLGLITSRFLKELGSPAEIFCRTSADPKFKHELVTPKGTLRDPDTGDIFRPQEQVVRVVEFETPAAILTAPSTSAVPQTYKQAYFDLVATGFKLSAKRAAGKQQGHLRLFFRFVGSPAHVRGFSEITLRLWRAAEPGQGQPHPADTCDLQMSLENTSASFTVGIELVLWRDGTDHDPTMVVVRLLRSDGTLKTWTPPKPPKLFKLADAGKDNAGFFVAVADTRGSGEFWTDVSLLHGPQKRGTSPLDLNWLFSPSAGGEPAALVAPAGLTDMIEAQARIVAVSPPIPIVSH